MISADRVTELLGEAASRLPQEIFHGLNLGIGVSDRAKRQHGTPGRDIYILAEYRVSHDLGRGILVYYGSLKRVYPDLSDDGEGRGIIESLLKHELTHHLEHLAGNHDLEIDDEIRLREMLRD
ncbi:MAG TPA: hypothetical protein VLA21_01640 [Candidatus Limnocylindria bacterium]|nr:hypothetical protein [Candidatus Limnocylindria bacterium]